MQMQEHQIYWFIGGAGEMFIDTPNVIIQVVENFIF